MAAVLSILALVMILALLIGFGGEISPGAWIEGLIVAAVLIMACIGFALYMAAHY